MRINLISYRVHAEHAAENEAFVRAVYEQLAVEQPDGIRYVTFVGEDGVTFTHLFLAESEEAAAALPRLEAVKRFQAGIRERVEEAPVAAMQREVGSYRFHAEGAVR